jgi:hypothetical protein
MLAATAPGDAGGPLCEALVAAGSPVDAADANGDTALFQAARCGAEGACRALLASGADPLRRNARNRTPALQLGLEPAMRALLADAEDAARAARAERSRAVWDAPLAATQTASACIVQAL